MKRLAVTLGILFLGIASVIGQTTPQKQRKTVEPIRPAIETMRSHRASQHTDMRQVPVPSATLRKNKAENDRAWPVVTSGSGKSAVKAEAVQPPFVCGFDYAKELEEKWTVTDGDMDERSWVYKTAEFRDTYDGGDESGFAVSGYNEKAETADYLITKSPIRMPAGKAYVAFHHASEGDGYVERLRVYYSTKPDARLADMKMVGEILDSTIDWKFGNLTFELPEAGDYYFCFLHCSEADQYNLYLDNVEIGTGDFVGTPELRINKVLLPLSSCGLGTAEPIGVQIWNTGTAAITKMSLSYSVNGGVAVTEEIAETIEASEIQVVYFTRKIDLSEEDADYTVSVSGTVLASDGNEEAVTDNNEGEGQVTHFSPAEALPFVINTENEEDLANLGYDPSAWLYDEEYGELNAVLPEPLVTRCVALEAGKPYRFTFDYLGGALIWGMYLIPEDFEVIYGLAGTPMETWDTLRTYEMVYTYNAVVYDEIWFTPETAGNYGFAIVPSEEEDGCNGTLFISRISVEAVYDHDVKMAGVRTSIGKRTPAQHAVAPRFETSVVNRGVNDEEGVKVTVKNGAAEVGVSSEIAIKSADTGHYAFVGKLDRPTAGTEVTLTFEAGMENADAYQEDNKSEWKFTATDGLYAFDLDIEDYYDGIGTTEFGFGQVFTLAEPDTLTEVSVGWFDLTEYYEEAFPVGLMIYPLGDDDEVGACILSHEFDRQLSGGVQTERIPARVLSAGRYLVVLQQLSSSNMALGFDEQPEGRFYVVADGHIFPESGYGYIALRAMFGKAENVVCKDLELLSIAKPKDRGLFTANEVIEVAYRNNGHDALEVEFKCKVGERELTSEKMTVAGYGMGTVSFEADMSSVGTYDIVVEAVVAEDENTANNEIKKTVECLRVDPYVMDFELCEDFAIEGLVPWTTIDKDGANTYGFSNAMWPNAYQPQGFIAFNPELAGVANRFKPRSGERLGCVFSAVEGVNDDWLISPQLLMPAEGARMKFYVKSLKVSETEVYTEEYEVYVSTTTNEPDAFMQIGTTRQAPLEWEEVVVDLSQYAGMEIYVAIRCVSEDQFVMMVDDIRVAGGLGVETTENLSLYVKSYPNPVTDVWTVTAYGSEIERVEICDMTGGIVYRSADNLSAETWRLNMAHFKPGLYVARVYTNVGVRMIKVTVR